MITYTPAKIQQAIKTVSGSSAWRGVETVIPAILSDFNIVPNNYLEFGVDRGYSISVMSNFFKQCTGVDTFEGDVHAGARDSNQFEVVSNALAEYKNITLCKSRFEDFILQEQPQYDLIHIDIVHLYEPTYKCAEWALQHSDTILLHDTESFPAIKQVCIDLAQKHSLNFFNISEFYGVGVLTRRRFRSQIRHE